MPKFLCITAHDPDGLDYGATLRVRHILRHLAGMGAVSVVLIGYHGSNNVRPEPLHREFNIVARIPCYYTDKPSIAHRVRRQLDARFLNIDGVQISPEERDKLNELISRHDMVWVHTAKVANATGIWHWPKSILDIDDISSEFSKTYVANSAGLVEKLRNLNQSILWHRQEHHLHSRFDALCVCSEPDRLKLPSSDKIFVIPNGFNALDKVPMRRPTVPPRIGFVGLFHYPPNRDGARWFVDNVWPNILGHFPAAQLRLAGDGGKEVAWNKPNIDALGFVPNIAAEMATWSLMVAPVFAGAGTRVKIADAFSGKCPVVSTRLGAYGYPVRDGRELFIADDPREFLAKCLRILERPAVGEALAENAWKNFGEKGTWNSHAGRIADIVGKVLNHPNPSGLNPSAFLEAA